MRHTTNKQESSLRVLTLTLQCRCAVIKVFNSLKVLEYSRDPALRIFGVSRGSLSTRWERVVT